MDNISHTFGNPQGRQSPHRLVSSAPLESPAAVKGLVLAALHCLLRTGILLSTHLLTHLLSFYLLPRMTRTWKLLPTVVAKEGLWPSGLPATVVPHSGPLSSHSLYLQCILDFIPQCLHVLWSRQVAVHMKGPHLPQPVEFVVIVQDIRFFPHSSNPAFLAQSSQVPLFYFCINPPCCICLFLFK